MASINYNGQILPYDTPLFGASNRGFRYGDGLFETMRYTREQVPMLSLHLERLAHGMHTLGFLIPGIFGQNFFKEEIKKMDPGPGDARIRLSIFRKDGGLYTPETDEVDFLLEWEPLPHRIPVPPAFIEQSGFLSAYPITPGVLSPFKTANSLPYVLASRTKKAMGWEEGVLLNQAGQVADGCHSNLFVVKDGQLFTPPVSEGALAGVMRSVMIQLAKDNQVPLNIRPIDIKECQEADEIWFSNAVRGIRWVRTFEKHDLKSTLWAEFYRPLVGLWEDGDFSSFHWYNR
ncbi:MAG: aminotransferase class IV [Saprospirales bacterium]|nr:aminotransferase class IV [Saprospirales bacterium]